jgi:hypothetical protein
MAAIDLFEALKKAKPVPISANSPVPELIQRVLVHTFVPELFNQLANPSKRSVRGQGKGGNTNYAESVLKPFFRKIGKVKFHPNGSQKPPDVKIDDTEFEWKSAKTLNSNFAFNDSVPKGGRYYCFYVRQAKRAIIIPGDVLVLGMNEEVVIRTYEAIIQARETGKDDGLCFFYPRINMYVRNFLRHTSVNGYFDFDRGVIWTPTN